jgi:hypothetical protein
MCRQAPEARGDPGERALVQHARAAALERAFLRPFTFAAVATAYAVRSTNPRRAAKVRMICPDLRPLMAASPNSTLATAATFGSVE